MNTTENNKLIAEFMGFELFESKYYELSEFGYIKTNGEWSDIFYPETLKFHKDWNWLMKVIKKIAGETEYELVSGYGYSYWNNAGENPLEKMAFGGYFGGYSEVLAIHQAVVEFIKWHNEQKN